MEKEKFGGVEPEIEKEINKEGWERETKELSEKLETEGKTEDLGTYIRLHKEIILPHSEVLDPELRKEIIEKKGHFILSPGVFKNYYGKERINKLHYIDKEGDITEIGIIVEDIMNLRKQLESYPKDKTVDSRRKIIIGELDKLGFVSDTSLEDEKKAMVQIINELWEKIFKVANEYKIKLEKEMAESALKEKKEEFDF